MSFVVSEYVNRLIIDETLFLLFELVLDRVINFEFRVSACQFESELDNFFDSHSNLVRNKIACGWITFLVDLCILLARELPLKTFNVIQEVMLFIIFEVPRPEKGKPELDGRDGWSGRFGWTVGMVGMDGRDESN